ncbi:MAG: DUF485 domain-containing protein [Chitinophagaceae bacterium]|nr:DUF485 domain-containing protein [Chitinophagaceae bacterium]
MDSKILSDQDTEHASEKKAKLGIKFFFLYLLFYAAFVIIGVLNYELFAIEVFRGVNLAVVYGMGLILFAVLLGILYNYLCTRYENQINKTEE